MENVRVAKKTWLEVKSQRLVIKHWYSRYLYSCLIDSVLTCEWIVVFKVNKVIFVRQHIFTELMYFRSWTAIINGVWASDHFHRAILLFSASCHYTTSVCSTPTWISVMRPSYALIFAAGVGRYMLPAMSPSTPTVAASRLSLYLTYTTVLSQYRDVTPVKRWRKAYPLSSTDL